MKLSEIKSYDQDPSKNTFSEFASPILEDLENVLGKWRQLHNTPVFVFDLSGDEKAQFRFDYQKFKRGHTKLNGITLVSAHHVSTSISFRPAKMHMADLHDDPEIQAKLIKRTGESNFSYFEENPEQLDDIMHIMQKHGADACSAGAGKNVTNENVHELLLNARMNSRGGTYGDEFELDWMFLTEPLE